MNRSQKVIVNATIGMGLQIVVLFITFVSRTFFIRYLGNSYLGLNGLFGNILTLLSMAELGFGTALVYNLFQASSKGDQNRVNGLMAFYKKVYRVIGLVIFILGLVMLPFLGLIVTDFPSDTNIYFVFLLFLINSSSSYLLSHILIYNEVKENRKITEILIASFTIVKEVVAILLLILTKNYYLYLINAIFFTLLIYTVGYIYMKKKYPELNDKTTIVLPKEVKKNIFINVYSLMIYQIASIVLYSVDGIIISVMLDLAVVGILSNYMLVMNAFKLVLSKVANALNGSLGLSNASGDHRRMQANFEKVNIVIYWMYGIVSLGIFFTVNDVILIWLGDSSYLFDQKVIFAIVLFFLLDGCSIGPYLFRTTLGLFNRAKFYPIVTIIVKVGASILLGHFFGLFGIIIGSSIARLSTFFIVDSILIHKYGFKSSSINYILDFIGFIVVLVISSTVIVLLSRVMFTNGIPGILLKGFIVVTVVSTLLFAYNIRKKSFRVMLRSLWNYLKMRRSK